MGNITGRINVYMAAKGLSVRSFEKSIDASNGVISNAIKKQSDISSGWLSVIIDKYTDISPEWLLTGQGTMLKPNTSQPEATKTPTKLSTTVKEDNNLLNHLQRENKELKTENKELIKQIGKLEGRLEAKDELIEDLKKEIPVPGFLRAVK